MNILNHKNTLKKAVIYCRVSTKEQVDDGNSLSTQEKICREYALKQGFEVDTIFIEKGESAKTVDRTELQHLLKYCSFRKNGISAIIVYKIDRLSRSTADYHEIRILLKRYGIQIYSTTEFFEDTPAGRFMENIIANVAQFDNDVRTERSMGGMRDAMREGRYVWMAPIGYTNVKVGGKTTIVKDHNATIVKRLFEEIAKNQYPIESIRHKMFREGLYNKSGKPLARSYFYTMLKNELYCGWIIKFGERHKGLFDPIVTQELFDQVQSVIKNRTRKSCHYLVKHPDFPLKRFIYHTNGSKLTGCWSKGKYKKYPYYRFESGKSYPKEVFEKAYIELMDKFQLKEEHYPVFKKKLQEYIGKGITNRQIDAEKIKKHIEDLKVRQKALIDKNLSGVISDIILREQLEGIESEVIGLNAELYREPLYTVNVHELIEFGSQYLKNPSEIWVKSNMDNKIRLQEFNFPKGISFNGNIFETPEICRLFKLKDIFLDEMSSIVPSRENILNSRMNMSHIITCTNENIFDSKSNTEEYRLKVFEELSILKQIISSVKEADDHIVETS